MAIKTPILSTELGTLWIVFQKKSMMVQVIKHFIQTAEGNDEKELLESFYKEETQFVNEIKEIFQQEGAAIPVGFTDNDVNMNVPPLFDHIFNIMYLRTMMKVAMGLHALHLTTAYREDIIRLYRTFSSTAEEYYEKTTHFLDKMGVLPKPPYVSIPKEVEFVKDQGYMSGFNLFSPKRALNTIEVNYIFQAIESNSVGMQMMTGFAQAANEQEVKQYFIKGKELSKKIISEMTQIMMQSDINVSSLWAGRAKDSTISPFSDKLMMYNTSLLSSFGLGSNALGTSFSLRSDLPLKMTLIAKDVYNFAKEGGKIMVKNGWMEEPPQMEDRGQLTT